MNTLKKLIFIFIIILLFSCDSHSQTTIIISNNIAKSKTVKVAGLTWQSNSIGTADNLDATIQELSEQSIFEMFQYPSETLEYLNVGAGNNRSNPGEHGIELGMAQYLTVPIKMPKYGINNTGIDVHMQGGIGYTNYHTLFVDPLLAQLDSQNINYQFIQIFFGGEEDANSDALSLAFPAKLDTLVSQYQSKFGSDVNLIFIEISALGRPYSARINDAYVAKAATSPYIHVIPSRNLSTALHFQYAPMKEVGRQVALLINSL